jgi:hypothetical protein
MFPEVSVEEGIRIFLTGGMALPASLEVSGDGDKRRDDGRARFSGKVTGRAG